MKPMNILLITKNGALTEKEALFLKADLEKMGYGVALAYCGAVSNTHDVRVEFLPQQ